MFLVSVVLEVASFQTSLFDVHISTSRNRILPISESNELARWYSLNWLLELSSFRVCRFWLHVSLGKMRFSITYFGFPCNAILRVFSCMGPSFPTLRRQTHQKWKAKRFENTSVVTCLNYYLGGAHDPPSLAPTSWKCVFPTQTPKQKIHHLSPQFQEPNPISQAIVKTSWKWTINNTFKSFVGWSSWSSKP